MAPKLVILEKKKKQNNTKKNPTDVMVDVMVARNNRRNQVAILLPLNVGMSWARGERELKKREDKWDHQQGNKLRFSLQLR